MTADELWLKAMWPFVRDHMPPAPARVLEIGCGPLGGFVPALRDQGHQAVGVDPRAPVLDDTTEADEQAAIDAGAIRATSLMYVGSAPFSGDSVGLPIDRQAPSRE